jgi:hypothetical protein
VCISSFSFDDVPIFAQNDIKPDQSLTLKFLLEIEVEKHLPFITQVRDKCFFLSHFRQIYLVNIWHCRLAR